jgi:hypothetical protein
VSIRLPPPPREKTSPENEQQWRETLWRAFNELRSEYDSAIALTRLTRNYVAATSAQYAAGGGASTAWLGLTGNSVSLTAGKWLLSGILDFSNNGVSPSYTEFEARWASANGPGNSTPPAQTTVEAGTQDLYLQLGATVSYGRIPMTTIRVGLASTTTIYLVPYFVASSAANARITTYIYAEQLG